MNKTPVVYYVRFGGTNPGIIGRRFAASHRDRGGGKRFEISTKPTSEKKFDAPVRLMSGVYSVREVSRLFDISESRLRYWDKSGILSPSGRTGRRKFYTFQDLISVRSVKTLLDNGISLQRTRRILQKLQEAIPRSAHPLSRLRIMADAKTVVVTDMDHEFEADTGQLLLDFEVKSLEREVVSQFPDKNFGEQTLSAYEWYLEGCRLDETPETLPLAEEAYHKAIHLDPTMANAYTNLGNLRYRLGSVMDARTLYEKAVEVDKDQPEAYYNLGFLEFEAHNFERAEQMFSKALELDTTFADAHFNLAVTLFRLEQNERAQQQLEIYLRLEPSGPWAEAARRRLQESAQL
jgi:DNA-binding transcriptional MerR regulator